MCIRDRFCDIINGGLYFMIFARQIIVDTRAAEQREQYLIRSADTIHLVKRVLDKALMFQPSVYFQYFAAVCNIKRKNFVAGNVRVKFQRTKMAFLCTNPFIVTPLGQNYNMGSIRYIAFSLTGVYGLCLLYTSRCV